MKKLQIAVLSALIAVFLSSCASKQLSPLESRIKQYISFEKVDKKIIKNFNYRTNANGLLEIELVLLSEDDFDLAYKLTWLDEDGFVLKAPTDGEFVKIKLKENQEFLVQRVATNKDAHSFNIILSKR